MTEKKIYFYCEQDGETENQFKDRLCHLFRSYFKQIRAYLVQVTYDHLIDDFHVALCIRIENEKNNSILNEIFLIFKSMFSYDQKLDILFLDHQQEISIREICCPFFISENYQFPTPDFYLFSSEGYGLNNPIACFKRKKLRGKNPDGYLLCDIYPSIIGQNYNIYTWPKDIKYLVFASRHLNYSLFPIKEWPAYVHVAVIIPKFLEDQDYYVDEKFLNLIAWGELYKKKEHIKKI